MNYIQKYIFILKPIEIKKVIYLLILMLIATLVEIIGVGLIIGMCVLDFVFWSIKSSEFKSEVATHLINTPAIWTPFMEVGGKVFTFGLLMSSCNYFKQSKLGVILVLIGTAVIYLPWGWDNIPGYLFITLGFYINFYRQSLSQNGSKQEI